MARSTRFSLLAILPLALSFAGCEEEPQPRGVHTSFDNENDVDEEDYADGEEAPPETVLYSLEWEATRNIRQADGLPAGCEYIDLYTGWVPHAGWQTGGWVPKGQRSILNARTSCGTIHMTVGYYDSDRGLQRSKTDSSAGGSGWYQQGVNIHAGEVYVNYVKVCLEGDSPETQHHANHCWGMYR